MDLSEQMMALDELLEESSDESSTEGNRGVPRARNLNSIFDSSQSSDDSWEDQGFLARNSIESGNFVQKILSYTSIEFKKNMKMERTTIGYLIERYGNSAFPPLRATRKRPAISYEKEIYMYIWYAVNTLTMKHLSLLFGVTKLSAWVAIRRVCRWLISITDEYIKWPDCSHAIANSRNFAALHKIPGILGAIQCFHVKVRPPSYNKDSYFNKESTYSITLQIVADPEFNLIDISCGEPGSLHDSRVLRRSDLYTNVSTNELIMFPDNKYLIGTASYSSLNWLIPPFKDYGTLTDGQKTFNRIHADTRKPAQVAFDMLKSRFVRFLHFNDQKSLPSVTNIIKSMCVLHNICISLNDSIEIETEDNGAGTSSGSRRGFGAGPSQNRIPSIEAQQRPPPPTNDRRHLLFSFLQGRNII